MRSRTRSRIRLRGWRCGERRRSGKIMLPVVLGQCFFLDVPRLVLTNSRISISLFLPPSFLPSFLPPLPSPPCSRHTTQTLTTTHQRTPPAPLAPPYAHLPLHKRCTVPASHELRGARVNRVRTAGRGEHTRVLRAPDVTSVRYRHLSSYLDINACPVRRLNSM
jgi:hypothetical protein